MAKKIVTKKPEHYCRDCAHAHSPHEIGYDGKPFLCKCPFFKYSRFLNRDTCNNFKMKG